MCERKALSKDSELVEITKIMTIENLNIIVHFVTIFFKFVSVTLCK